MILSVIGNLICNVFVHILCCITFWSSNILLLPLLFSANKLRKCFGKMSYLFCANHKKVVFEELQKACNLLCNLLYSLRWFFIFLLKNFHVLLWMAFKKPTFAVSFCAELILYHLSTQCSMFYDIGWEGTLLSDPSLWERTTLFIQASGQQRVHWK